MTAPHLGSAAATTPAAPNPALPAPAPASAMAAYGLLGMPLAMAALPVYVQVPAYYASELGLALSATGTVLFAARLLDTVQDPFLGRWIDHLAQRGKLAPALWLACLVLSASFAMLWLPPVRGGALAAWLALSLVLVYSAHSVVNIAYLAWGARLSREPATLTRAAAWREAAGLAGVMLASVLPAWLLGASGWPAAPAMAGYALVFAALLLGALALLLRRAPAWRHHSAGVHGWRATLANRAFRRLLLPYFLNAVSVSIPATLALFFIQDRLGAPQWSGAFLAAYFAAGAAGLPLWTRLCARIGPTRAWRLGMVLAVAAFVWAAGLDTGDTGAYLAVCVLAGLALGADLALPPVLLACLIPPGEQPGGYYGIWSLLGKLALALSGLALPLLAWCGYQPGAGGTAAGSHALALVYGGLPCLFKLAAMLCLRTAPAPLMEDPT
ncbi:MFS transporter [Cupriavidus basilensis]|uniref:MFS transporter n=1 Tax=Cupriavidus basilensis TaxID=68895 RepID=A0A643G2N9_9BURK|nr:MFS transporter [Cupriavidus basilensis]QOT78728.1 MFS transporter [Cupriavidus basilensis]